MQTTPSNTAVPFHRKNMLGSHGELLICKYGESQKTYSHLFACDPCCRSVCRTPYHMIHYSQTVCCRSVYQLTSYQLINLGYHTRKKITIKEIATCILFSCNQSLHGGYQFKYNTASYVIIDFLVPRQKMT